MLKLSLANNEQFERINQLDAAYFPENESIDCKRLMELKRQGILKFYALTDTEQFGNTTLGGASIISHNHLNLWYVFVIDEALRTHGIGQQAITLINSLYEEEGLFGEIESPDYMEKSHLDLRNYYLRNGFQSTGIRVSMGGNSLEVLARNCNITPEIYLDFYYSLFGKQYIEEEFQLKILSIN